MNKKGNFIKNMLIFLSALFLNVYIFLGHFYFPISPTYFLYIGVICLIISVFLNRKIRINKGIIIYILILIVTVIGTIYTQDLYNSKRQLLFFLIYGLIYFVVNQKDEELSSKFMIIYLYFSIAVLISVYLQFFFSVQFNTFLSRNVSAEMLSTIMQAFNVDKSYVGISPSVTLTSFSLGVLMFKSGIEIINSFFSKNEKIMSHKLDLIILITAFFGIILTNKRGIFVATIIAFLISVYFNKDISFKKISKSRFVLFLIFIFLITSVGIYTFSTNSNVAHFINRFHSDNMLTGREVFYENAIKKLNDGGLFSWTFGMGTGSAYVINETALHNVYLQIIYDHGFIGFIIFISFFGYNLIKSIKKISNETFIQLAVQLTFLVYCMSGNPLYSYYIMIPYLVFCVYEKKRKEELK